jgi:hypothetical protein
MGQSPSSLKRGREPDDEPDDERRVQPRRQQAETIARELASAEDTLRKARGIQGPRVATGVQLVARWPSGGAIWTSVLLLGERHHPDNGRPEDVLSVRQLLQAAGERARRAGACVDFYVENAFQRCRTVDGRAVRRDRTHPRQLTGGRLTLSEIAWSTAGAVRPPRSTDQQQRTDPFCGAVRVHWFDSRPESSTDLPSAARTVLHRFYSENRPDVPGAAGRRWMLALMGLAPSGALPDEPPTLPADLLVALGSRHLPDFVRAHDASVRRVSRRARRMAPDDLAWLARHTVDTVPVQEGDWYLMSDVLANTADYCLLLRMLLPYAADRACPAGAPRHCCVYAGQWHTDHVAATFQAMGATARPLGEERGEWMGQPWLSVEPELLLQQMGLG